MQLKSPVFEPNQPIPSKYTCDEENVNPPLEIEDVPKEAESLALIVDDPDAPGKSWVHWVVWNIDPKTKGILEASLPQGGQEGVTDFGRTGYGGPCPASGQHHYFFKLYALDKKLELGDNATRADLEKAMQGHILAEAELIGLYKRS